MQFDRVVDYGLDGAKKRVLMMPDMEGGDVTGHLVNGRGPSTTEADGIGVLLSPRPAEMAAFLAGELEPADLLAMHQNGNGRNNVVASGTAELVTGFVDGIPQVAGRLKNGEFVERDPVVAAKIGEFLGETAEVLN